MLYYYISLTEPPRASAPQTPILMNRTTSKGLAVALTIQAFFSAPLAFAIEQPVTVVAAENFYGDLARQIGGSNITVTSIINNPAQDPHLFEVTPGTARLIGEANIVIFNGAGYDSWIERFLKATSRTGRIEINAAFITGKKPGDNPHLWYDPAAAPKIVTALAEALRKADAKHANDYAVAQTATLASLDRVTHRAAQLKAKYAKVPVTATEPVFGAMADAIGLSMRNKNFQRAVMNDVEPSAHDLAAFENDLKNKTVKALIYNKQVSGTLSERLREIAVMANVPTVAVTETMPENTSFTDWMLSELDALDKALSGQNP
jgi:zinc/manganese transport system substrate-binding protein